jgi:hypothetical protein
VVEPVVALVVGSPPVPAAPPVPEVVPSESPQAEARARSKRPARAGNEVFETIRMELSQGATFEAHARRPPDAPHALPVDARAQGAPVFG